MILTMRLAIACACILSVWAAENKSSTVSVEEKPLETKKDLIAQEARRQSSFKPPLRNIPSPGSEYGLVDEYPPTGYVPQSHSDRYGSQPPSGGYGSSAPSSGYNPSYPSSGYGSSQSSGGYGSSYPSSGYGSSDPSSGYGTSHPSSGYGASHPSSGYGASHPSTGYGASHPSNGYGSSYPSSGHGLSHPSSSYGSSHPSGGYDSSFPSGGYGSSHPSSGYTGSQPASGYGSAHSSGGYGSSYPSSGYGSSRPSNNYGPSHSSNAYGSPVAPSSAYGPTHASGGYGEYGPESVRNVFSPVSSHYSPPPPPTSHSNGGYLKIGSTVHGGGGDGYFRNSHGFLRPSGYSKSPESYSGPDGYPKSPVSYRNKRKPSAIEENYPKPFKNSGISGEGYRNPPGAKSHKQSDGYGDYTKAPLSSGGYSQPQTGYDSNGGYDKRTASAYGDYDKSPRGYRTYDKPVSGYSGGYNKAPLSYSKSTENGYGSRSKSVGSKSFSNPSHDGYEKTPGSYSGYDKPIKATGHSKFSSGYDDYGKTHEGYSRPRGSRNTAKSGGYPRQNSYDKPAAKYAGFTKPAGSPGASQYDGGYGGYATGPPPRGFGDYSKNPPGYPEPAGYSSYRPSVSDEYSAGQLPSNGYGKTYGKVTQTGYSKAYDTYSTGAPNLSGFDFGGNGFTRKGLLGDHGLYGAASYGRNYRLGRFNDLGNKAYSADQSIYGGYAHLY